MVYIVQKDYTIWWQFPLEPYLSDNIPPADLQTVGSTDSQATLDMYRLSPQSLLLFLFLTYTRALVLGSSMYNVCRIMRLVFVQ